MAFLLHFDIQGMCIILSSVVYLLPITISPKFSTYGKVQSRGRSSSCGGNLGFECLYQGANATLHLQLSRLPSTNLDAGHDGHERFPHQPNGHDRLQLPPWIPMWNEDRLAVDERFLGRS